MCGICGIIDNQNIHNNTELIKKMNNLLVHRGPDSEGYFIKDNVFLGVRRLSIIDLKTGDQPISNENNTIHLVFNGEIYNFLDLKKELSSHNFKTKTDTEVIIHLYEQHGEDFIHKLRGMFAFALWDDKKKKLILARDRIGKKPLVWAKINNGIIFASEIKSLLVHPEIKREIDIDSLNFFLAYRYLPAPKTIFKCIEKLPHASMLIFDKNNIRIKKYWNLKFFPKIKISQDELKIELLNLLKESVKIRLISDVPLGMFLSGGVDSSTVTWIVSEFLNQKLKTFTIGFEDEDYSEIKYARVVSERFNTEHCEFIVKPNIIEILPELVWYYNEPYGDSSCIVTFYLAKEARKYITVALNGDGGDENFAGYEWYYLIKKYFYIWDRLSDKLKFFLLFLKHNFLPHKLKRYLFYASKTYEFRYLEWIKYFQDDLRKKILQPQFFIDTLEETIFTKHFYDIDSDNLLDRHLNIDFNTYLPYDLTVKMDTATMANSLEARSPLLDSKLIEFCAKIPPNLKIKRSKTKIIFKNILEQNLPQQIIKRKKHGFVVPLKRWFKNELNQFVRITLLKKNSAVNKFFNPEVIKEIVELHSKGEKNFAGNIWLLLFFEYWYQIFIENKKLL